MSNDGQSPLRKTFGAGGSALSSAAAKGWGGVSVIHDLQVERLSRWLSTEPGLADGSRGVLDVGCGSGFAQASIEAAGLAYFGCDMGLHGPETSAQLFWCDGTRLAVRSNALAGVICLEVAEHVADVDALLHEIQRVLRPGGAAFVSIPFAQPLHEEPRDFWRWTEHGLRKVFVDIGFTDVVVEPRGSLLSLAQHSLGTVAVGIASRLGLSDRWAVRIGRWTAGVLGRMPLFRRPLRVFPHGYWVTCRKRATASPNSSSRGLDEPPAPRTPGPRD